MFTANKEQITIDGIMYYCIYGKYESGAWLCILNFGVAAELSASPFDTAYNTDKIIKALEHSPDAAWLPQLEDARKKIAQEILKHVIK